MLCFQETVMVSSAPCLTLWITNCNFLEGARYKTKSSYTTNEHQLIFSQQFGWYLSLKKKHLIC